MLLSFVLKIVQKVVVKLFELVRTEWTVHHRAVLSPEAQYLRRRKSALWMTVSLLALALLVLTVGLISATRTDNVPVAGYYPGIIVSPMQSAWQTLSHLPLLKLLPIKADCLCSGHPAEFWRLSGNRWNPPGGKSKTNGESASTIQCEN